MNIPVKVIHTNIYIRLFPKHIVLQLKLINQIVHPCLKPSIPIPNLLYREEMSIYTPQSTLQECPALTHCFSNFNMGET